MAGKGRFALSEKGRVSHQVPGSDGESVQPGNQQGGIRNRRLILACRLEGYLHPRPDSSRVTSVLDGGEMTTVMRRVLALVGVGLIVLGTLSALDAISGPSALLVAWAGEGNPPGTRGREVSEVALDRSGPLVTRTLVLLNNTLVSGNFLARNGLQPVNAVYDGGKGELFVANFASNTVSVISDATSQVLATIPVGINPNGIAYDSGKGEVFVANTGPNTVSVISDATNTVVATISVASSPSGIAYDGGKGEVFVASQLSNSVEVISDTTNAVVATIPGGGVGLAYDSGKGEVFLASYDIVSVISDATNVVVATVTVGSSAVGLVYDSGKGEVFVARPPSNDVSVISDATDTVVATIPVGSNPDG